MPNKGIAYEIKITGIVQGVGFRPYIRNLATSLSLLGWVSNVDSSVVMEVEGTYELLQEFVRRILDKAPVLSRIKNIIVTEKPYSGYKDFTIRESTRSREQNTYISPDVSICEDCIRELFDSDDRRFLYPFINCTNCGPRFTIVKGIPYDREYTTMSPFVMCERCKAEYHEPSDRRYHAQPVSCYDCGPQLKLIDWEGKSVDSDRILQHTCKLIRDGKIIAVKGLGGYHLVCDAKNAAAVSNLRKRKIRDDKPFALMVKDTDTAGRYCYINENEKNLLESEQKPIVLLRIKESQSLPVEIAPNNPNLGIMLPYTPVHLLLFYLSDLDTLVMTSGNRSREPIYCKDEDAFSNLQAIADYFLMNDREIFIRTDDSVTRVFRNREYIIRRSRGYVPMPVTCSNLGLNLPSVLACGGELKNTFCLNKGEEFYLSHHIGDLENAETLISFEEGIEHFKKIFGIKYDVVAYDLHPEYLSTKYAAALDVKDRIAVQHHHAHIASCMAENSLNEDVIGVAFDGTGYGEDGHIWGGEFFTGGYQGFKRVGYLEYVKMPGGEMAVKEPWRMAVSYLYHVFKDIHDSNEDFGGIHIGQVTSLLGVDQEKVKAVIQMMDKNINSPLTSSMGRLFDAVSALLGVRGKINYEGQAAIELEYIVDSAVKEGYDFSIQYEGDVSVIHVSNMIEGIVKDVMNSVDKAIIASKFHETVSRLIVECCKRVRDATGLNKAVLSGGVFQNMTLLEKCMERLESNGFNVYIHSKVPSNDGGIALGQAVIAAFKLRNTR